MIWKNKGEKHERKNDARNISILEVKAKFIPSASSAETVTITALFCIVGSLQDNIHRSTNE